MRCDILVGSLNGRFVVVDSGSEISFRGFEFGLRRYQRELCGVKPVGRSTARFRLVPDFNGFVNLLVRFDEFLENSDLVGIECYGLPGRFSIKLLR